MTTTDPRDLAEVSSPPPLRNTPEQLMKDNQVEALLGVADGWAAKDRIGPARIPFVKIGRSVRYRKSDVLAFIDANIRQSTSDGGAR